MEKKIIYKNIKVDRLRNFLKMNNQKKSGKKEELIERIKLILKFGKFPSCIKCKSKMILKEGVLDMYVCPGKFNLSNKGYDICDYFKELNLNEKEELNFENYLDIKNIFENNNNFQIKIIKKELEKENEKSLILKKKLLILEEKIKRTTLEYNILYNNTSKLIKKK